MGFVSCCLNPRSFGGWSVILFHLQFWLARGLVRNGGYQSGDRYVDLSITNDPTVE